jgi:hypothetical protein
MFVPRSRHASASSAYVRAVSVRAISFAGFCFTTSIEAG